MPLLSPSRSCMGALQASALVGAMAAPALAQDTEGRAMSGDLGIYYQVHGDLDSGMVHISRAPWGAWAPSKGTSVHSCRPLL